MLHYTALRHVLFFTKLYFSTCTSSFKLLVEFLLLFFCFFITFFRPQIRLRLYDNLFRMLGELSSGGRIPIGSSVRGCFGGAGHLLFASWWRPDHQPLYLPRHSKLYLIGGYRHERSLDLQIGPAKVDESSASDLSSHSATPRRHVPEPISNSRITFFKTKIAVNVLINQHYGRAGAPRTPTTIAHRRKDEQETASW